MPPARSSRPGARRSRARRVQPRCANAVTATAVSVVLALIRMTVTESACGRNPLARPIFGPRSVARRTRKIGPAADDMHTHPGDPLRNDRGGTMVRKSRCATARCGRGRSADTRHWGSRSLSQGREPARTRRHPSTWSATSSPAFCSRSPSRSGSSATALASALRLVRRRVRRAHVRRDVGQRRRRRPELVRGLRGSRQPCDPRRLRRRSRGRSGAKEGTARALAALLVVYVPAGLIGAEVGGGLVAAIPWALVAAGVVRPRALLVVGAPRADRLPAAAPS